MSPYFDAPWFESTEVVSEVVALVVKLLVAVLERLLVADDDTELVLEEV